MATFSDSLGRKWTIEFDGPLLDKIEKEAGVNLADLSAGGLFTVETDVRALARVLPVVCAIQLQEQRIPAESLAKQIRKDAITLAKEAVRDALADFFPQSEWSAMLSNLTKRENQTEVDPEQLTLAMTFAKMDPAAQREILQMIREEKATEAGSFTESAHEPSAHGQESTLPTPAIVSLESVELNQME